MTDPKPWSALVEAFREVATVPDARVDEAWHEVKARARAGEVPSLDGSSGIGGSAVAKLIVVGAVVVAGVGAIVGLAGDDPDASGEVAARPGVAEPPTEIADPIEARSGLPRAATPSASPDPATDSSPASVAEPDPTPSEPTPSDPAPSDPTTSNAEPEPSADSPPRERPSSRSRTKSRRDPPPSDTLGEELALLQRARAALRGGDPARAKSLVATHRTRFPDSELAEERSLTEIAALCALGKPDAAQAKAARFRERFPSSTRDASSVAKCSAPSDKKAD